MPYQDPEELGARREGERRTRSRRPGIPQVPGPEDLRIVARPVNRFEGVANTRDAGLDALYNALLQEGTRTSRLFAQEARRKADNEIDEGLVAFATSGAGSLKEFYQQNPEMRGLSHNFQIGIEEAAGSAMAAEAAAATVDALRSGQLGVDLEKASTAELAAAIRQDMLARVPEEADEYAREAFAARMEESVTPILREALATKSELRTEAYFREKGRAVRGDAREADNVTDWDTFVLQQTMGILESIERDGVSEADARMAVANSTIAYVYERANTEVEYNETMVDNAMDALIDLAAGDPRLLAEIESARYTAYNRIEARKTRMEAGKEAARERAFEQIGARMVYAERGSDEWHALTDALIQQAGLTEANKLTDAVISIQNNRNANPRLDALVRANIFAGKYESIYEVYTSGASMEAFQSLSDDWERVRSTPAIRDAYVAEQRKMIERLAKSAGADIYNTNSPMVLGENGTFIDPRSEGQINLNYRALSAMNFFNDQVMSLSPIYRDRPQEFRIGVAEAASNAMKFINGSGKMPIEIYKEDPNSPVPTDKAAMSALLNSMSLKDMVGEVKRLDSLFQAKHLGVVYRDETTGVYKYRPEVNEYMAELKMRIEYEMLPSTGNDFLDWYTRPPQYFTPF